MPYRNIVVAEYMAMFVVWLTVVIVYWVSTRGAWMRSPEGRLMMADAVLFVWFGVLVLAGIFFHDWPGRVYISLVSLGFITVTGLWRLRIIVKAQQLKRRLLADQGRMMTRLNRMADGNGGQTAREVDEDSRRGPHASDRSQQLDATGAASLPPPGTTLPPPPPPSSGARG